MKFLDHFDGFPQRVMALVFLVEKEHPKWSGRRKRKWVITQLSKDFDEDMEWGNGVIGSLIERFDDSAFYIVARVGVEVVVYFLKNFSQLPGLEEIVSVLMMEGEEAFNEKFTVTVTKKTKELK